MAEAEQVVRTFATMVTDGDVMTSKPASNDQWLVKDVSAADGDRSKVAETDVMLMGRAQTTSTHTCELVSSDGLLQNSLNLHGKSIVTYNNNQYVAYYNSDKTVTLKSRQVLPTVGAWEDTNVLTGKTTAATDDHNTIALGIDDAGFLHIAYDMHGSALKYFKMPTSESIAGTAGSNISMVGTNESEATYPKFFNDNSGNLYFMFRDGISGAADEYFYAYTSGTTTWAAATGTSTAGLFYDGKNESPDVNSYVSAPFVDSDNVAHFAHTWVETSVGGTEYDPGYVAYNFTTSAVTQADGTTQTVPITPSNDDTVVTVPQGEYPSKPTQHRVTWSNPTTGYVYVLVEYYDADNIQQLYLMTNNTSIWSAKQLTFRAESPPSLNPTLALLVDSANVMYAIYPEQTTTYGSQVIESRDLGVTWSAPYMVGFAHGQSSGHTNIDYQLWDSDDIFNRLVQPVPTGFGASPTYAGTQRSVYIERWVPSEGAKDAQYLQNSLFAEDDVWIRSKSGAIDISSAGGVIMRTSNAQVFSMDSDGDLQITSVASTVPEMVFRAGNGTLTAPTTLTSGDKFARFGCQGHNGTSYQTGSQIYMEATETWSGSQKGNKMVFTTAENGTTSVTAKMTINGDGSIDIPEQTAPAAPAANTARLYVDDSGGKTRLMVRFPSGAAQQIAIEP